MRLMEIVPLKTQLRFGFVLMVAAVAGLMLSHSIALFSAAMFVLGPVSGITMSIGTFLITHMYEGRQRGARLLFTDSFFSMAGMIFPMVAAYLLARSIEWYWVYACIGLVYVAIFILTFGCEFPVLGKSADYIRAGCERKMGYRRTVPLHRRAVLHPRPAGLYLRVPEYAKGLGMSLNDAGKLVSDFWMSYMFGMWAFSFILRFFDLQRILTVLAGLATVLMYLFINGSPEHMPWFILTGLLLQRDLYLDHHPWLSSDQSGLAKAGELRADMRHHRHHADLRGHGPDCCAQRPAGGAAYR